MKKTRFLALASLCSILAGMPANAQKIKDSDAKKIGGVETQVDKENSNNTSKNEVKGKFDLDYVKRFIKDPEFIKYAKIISGLAAVWGTHEGLSYFKGKPGQFYEKLAWLSVTGQVRKRQKIKSLLDSAIAKIKVLDSNRLFDKAICNEGMFDNLNVGNVGEDCVTQPEKLDDEKLDDKKLRIAIFANTDLNQEEYNKVKEYFDFYICYFKQNLKGIKLVYCLKGHEKELFSAASKVNSVQTMAEFDNKFTLLSAVKM